MSSIWPLKFCHICRGPFRDCDPFWFFDFKVHALICISAFLISTFCIRPDDMIYQALMACSHQILHQQCHHPDLHPGSARHPWTGQALCWCRSGVGYVRPAAGRVQFKKQIKTKHFSWQNIHGEKFICDMLACTEIAFEKVLPSEYTTTTKYSES